MITTSIKNNDKLDIVVSYDHLHDSIFYTFFQTSFNRFNLSQFFNLHTHRIDTKVDTQTDFELGFLSARYISARAQQFRNISEYIERKLSLQTQNFAISMDSDIIFFPFFQEAIQENIVQDNGSVDLFFMSENSTQNLPNTGFIIFKTNTKSLSFFRECIDVYQTYDTEHILQMPQNMINICNRNTITYKILNLQFINNNYPSDMYSHYKNQHKLACFHATSTLNLLDKAEVLNRMIMNMEDYNNRFISFIQTQGINPYAWIEKLNTHNIHQKGL